jgi:hypothetical protein
MLKRALLLDELYDSFLMGERHFNGAGVKIDFKKISL